MPQCKNSAYKNIKIKTVIIGVTIAALCVSFNFTQTDQVWASDQDVNVSVIEPALQQEYESDSVLVVNVSDLKKSTGAALVDLPQSMSVEKALDEPDALIKASGMTFASSDEVVIQPNYTYRLNSTKVNDVLVDEQYYLESINAYEGWDYLKSENAVTVAVLDSGVSLDHVDLDNIDLAHAIDLSTSTSYVDKYSGNPMTSDDVGHGTEVSGVIAATADNGIGIAGVSHNMATVLPIRIFDKSGSTSSAKIVYAIKYLLELQDSEDDPDVRIVNMSFGMDYPDETAAKEADPALYASINELLDNDYVVVAAGGNGQDENGNNNGFCLPGDMEGVICVTATEENGTELLATSGIGQKTVEYNQYKDITAPGERIYTTSADDNSSSEYDWVDGTSLSTPMVSAAAAMILSQYPSLTSTQVSGLLYDSAVDIGEPGRDDSFGYGMLDVGEAMRIASIKYGTAYRLSGSNRYETAAEAVDSGFDSFSKVIIASGENFPDALAANGLAGIYGCPVVLSSSDELGEATRNLILESGVSQAYIVGGTSAISNSVADELKSLGIIVTRLAGVDRNDTANVVYDSTSAWGKTAIIASGVNPADALSASPLSYTLDAPVFLTLADGTLDTSTIANISTGAFESILVLGGTNAVDAGVEETLQSLGVSITRFAGVDRFDTSSQVCAWAVANTEMEYEGMYFATGANESNGVMKFADALGAGGAAAENSTVLMLIDSSDEGEAGILTLKNAVNTYRILGGTAAISVDLSDYLYSELN